MHARWLPSLILFALTAPAPRTSAAPPLDAESYNQWKRALQAPAATPAEDIRTLPGFRIALIRSARADEGSWVAMAFDPQGRIVIAREERGLLRMTLPGAAAEVIDDTLLEVRGLLFAHDALFANASSSRGLHRLRDTDGDDRFDEIKLLRTTPGGVGHGRNQLALGPDGLIYSIHGDDVQAPEGGFDASSPFSNFREDALLPVPWERHLSNNHVRAPGGHLVRTDADGRRWEIVCGGLRNPFGIAFNAGGEAFTYDADMEWDVGLPWHHPTRVLHLVSGADYGWRGGSRPLPAWLPDVHPAVVDLGKGSPTAVIFGTASRWPEPWKSALYALDWAYGRVHAVQLAASGASYSGTAEIFLEGRPFNVTGAAFGPDGNLYLITGGRRTQSGLYRVSWIGGAGNAGAPPRDPDAVKARALRRKLETFHGRENPAAIETAWPHLDHRDPWIRQAARVAIEAQPPEAWIERAFAEARPAAALEAALALARVGGIANQPRLLERMRGFDLAKLAPEEQLAWARALELSFLRDDPQPAAAFASQIDAALPARDPRVNWLLCDLLVFARAPSAVARTLAVSGLAETQEERLHGLSALAGIETGWTPALRRAWLEQFLRARRESIGGPALGTNLSFLQDAFERALTAEEKSELSAELLAARLAAPLPAAPEPRAFVRHWTMADATAALADLPGAPDAAAGRSLFDAIGCAQCHRFGEAGGTPGPELTEVGRRFDARALLESMIEPSRVVADPYRGVSLVLKSGEVVDGRLLSEEGDAVRIAPNPIAPERDRRIAHAEIAQTTLRSPMPPGLLDTLTAAEVRDLLAWLQAPR